MQHKGLRLEIFLKFWSFWSSFSCKHFSYKKTCINMTKIKQYLNHKLFCQIQKSIRGEMSRLSNKNLYLFISTCVKDKRNRYSIEEWRSRNWPLKARNVWICWMENLMFWFHVLFHPCLYLNSINMLKVTTTRKLCVY